MDPATPFSREADPEEELANISQPSSFQSTQMADTSDSSALDHEEDADSTTFDEFHDARSEISSTSSLRSPISSFSISQMASASRESLNSVRSMLFAPSFGTLRMNIRELVQYLQSKHRLSRTSILDMTTYKSQSVVKHMFVVLRLKQRRGECWLRLDRRMVEPANALFTFPRMQGPARDEVYCVLFF